MKTMLAVLLTLAMPAAAQIKNPDTFTYVTIGDVDSLDPAWAYDTASHGIIANVYELLVQYKGASLSEMEPLLASKVPSRANGLISADGLTYTFPIRKGIKFHDGTPFGPEDVKYSLMRFMLYDRAGGPSSLLLDPILGVNSTRDEKGVPIADLFKRADKAITVSGDNVSIRISRPFAPFLSVMAGHSYIISKFFCVKNGCWDGMEATWIANNNPKKESSYLLEHMNGTGAFKLDRWDKQGRETWLSRNENYWRKPAKLKRVLIKGVEEFQTRKLMLAAGDADVAYAPTSNLPQLKDIPGVKLFTGLNLLESPMAVAFTFQLNPTANPNIGSGRLDGAGIPPDFFSDKDVRKAVAYSVDYEAYIRDVMRGMGNPTHGLIPADLLGHDPKGKNYTFDLAKAAEHLKKAWKGQAWEKGFQFTLMYNDNQPNVQALCNMIKKNVESLNPKFKIDVRTIQWSSFLEQSQQRKVPMFVVAWEADYPDPHNMIFPFLHSDGDYPVRQGYKNPELDKLIGQAVTELDRAKREKLYRRIQEIAYEEVPDILIADRQRMRAQRTWVKGWVLRRVFPDSPYGSYYYDLSKEGN